MARPEIRIIAFKGCIPALRLHDDLRMRLAGRGPGVVGLTVVPTPDLAGRMGLHGSPTIIAGGREFQAGRRGPAGFY
jgi:hypothetical protein